MGDIPLLFLAGTTLVVAPIGIAWFGRASVVESTPFAFAKVALKGYLCCVVIVWGAMAIMPIADRPAVATWSVAVWFGSLASVALSCALAMLASVLLAYRAMRRLPQPRALVCAAALGAVNLALFLIFFVGPSCVFLFAC